MDKSNKKSNGIKPRLSFTPPVKTIGEVLEIGENAGRLIGAPVFVLAYKSLIQNIQDEIVSTQPEEQKRREWLYTKIQALSEAVDELGTFFNIANSLNESDLTEETANQMREFQNTEMYLGDSNNH